MGWALWPGNPCSPGGIRTIRGSGRADANGKPGKGQFNPHNVDAPSGAPETEVRAAQGARLNEAAHVEPGEVVGGHPPARRALSFFTGLRGRLLLLTVAFILVSELLVFPLLAANARRGWLQQRAQAAQIAALAVEAAPDGRVSEGLSRELLSQAQVVSVAVQADDFRELVLAPSIKIQGPLVRIDLRGDPPPSITGVFETLFAPSGRFIQIIITPSMTNDREMEIIVPESALKAALIGLSRTIFIVSLIISAVVGAMVYLAIYRLVVRPMQGLTDAVIRFSDAPEGAEIAFKPARSDEMRRAQTALQDMQKQVSASFRQRKRLADLGEAVAKINHDLRNSLSAAQIVSEGLAQSEDPRVKRAAPRLERALERAIGLAEATLRYGRAEQPRPQVGAVNVIPLIEEAASEALSGSPGVDWKLEAPDQLSALADPDHLHRIVANLVRNAARAMADQPGRNMPDRIRARAFREDACVIVEIVDNGPGVPNSVMGRLFQPFAGSGSRDGAGLGLAIARELARGMKGELELSSSDDTGAAFTLRVPAA